ncbi:carbohydrate ABC transporter permease [Pseudothermotoga thermarum]|uniref:Carbohydrate ABC transporter membrane protein 1, CUT1 family n=1 Tax=Pseudothermotoga thermarum DSM 5069 TaxID=688269 RepID=F7YXR1_9THEM|nr:sugar ABC transporter permease [Pseudothermotoga thermarum]AEH50705.1 carbohydrate ABC transporter membrane protein 1, CUT1 family [Pseudothermotoga thermarum DSM 5069]
MKRRTREALLAYLFLLPSFVILGIFVFWPIGFSFVLSFFKWDFKNMKNPVFAGLENYRELFRFFTPLSHSFAHSLLSTCLIFILCLGIVVAIYGLVGTKKPITLALLILSLMGVLFIQGGFAVVLGIVVLALAIYLIIKNKFFLKHLAGILSFTFIGFIVALMYDHRVYTVVDFLLEGKERNVFIKAIYNTVYYVLLTVPITLALSLFVAILLNSNVKFRTLFTTIYFIPFVTSSVAISLVWRWIFDDHFGLLNYLLSFLNIQRIAWLKDEKWTIPTIAIVSIWRTIGYDAVIFLAGLQNIDKTYYEAAEVDGAKAWHRFFYITWPLLSPTTFFLLIVSMISSFKVFTEVYVLYSGLPGPYNNSGMTMVYYVFDRFYVQQRMGIACAAAYILVAIVLVLTAIQFMAGKKVVHYVS